MGLLSSIGGAFGSIFGGGGGASADSSNDVELTVTSDPVINIDFDGLSAGIVTGFDEFGDDIGGAITKFSSNMGFVVIVGALILVIGRN